jgi:beta-lactamase regulating signal transducer with metallopeptidase domain
MLDGFLLSWNQVTGVVLAAFVNALPASILLTVAAWIVMHFLGRWTAASRYCVWWIVLAFVVVIPTAHPFLPDHSKPFRTEMHGSMAPGKHVSAIHSNSVTTPVASPALRDGNPEPSGFTISGVLLFVWIFISAVQFARLVLAFWNTRNLKRSAMEPAAELKRQWHERLEAYAFRRPVALGLSAKIATPVVTGYARPTVLLPVRVIDRLSSDELDQILSHELAHVRRYDDWAIALQRCVEAVLVLHPLVRLIAKRIELEREIACDDWVLSTQRPQAYASCLTKLAELRVVARSNRLATAAVEHKSQLSRRIEMLLDNTRAIKTHVSLRSLGSIAVLLLILALASLRLPRLMAYPVAPQAPAPPPVPASPKPPAPAVPKPPAPAAQKPPAPDAPKLPASVAPKPPVLPESLPGAQHPSLPPPVAMQGDMLRWLGQTMDHVESTAQQQKLLEDMVRRATEQPKMIDPKLNREAMDKVMAQVKSELKALENAMDYNEIKRQMENAQKQAGQIDSEKLIRDLERSQKEISQTDLAELKREIERCKQELSHINVDELKREIKRLEDEVHALSKDSGRRVP